jgi:2,3-diphosphopglycerate-independent phosphoglycerate mutase
MKTVLVIIEGAADVPRAELDKRSPLEVARCPSATRLAVEGRGGLIAPQKPRFNGRHEIPLAIWSGTSPEDATAIGRGPLEWEDAAGDWGNFNYAYAGSFVTIDNGVLREPNLWQLSLEETRLLCTAIQEYFDPNEAKLLPISGGRVVVGLKAGGMPEPGVQPWLVRDDTEAVMLSAKKSELGRRIMDKAASVLENVTVNDVRVDLGENPATHLWLWGGGPPPKRPSLVGGRGRKFTMVTDSRMAAGFAKLCHMDVASLGDPWSEVAESPAVSAADFEKHLKGCDMLTVYVGAPGRAGGYGTAAQKVHLLDRVDLMVLAPLLEAVCKTSHVRVVLATDGFLPSKAVKAPWVVWGQGVEADNVQHWDEVGCRDGGLGVVTPEDMQQVLVET